MSKKVVLYILVVLDVLLGILFFVKLVGASKELAWAYYEREGIASEDLLKYLDWESYGDVAVMSRSGRVGAEVQAEDQDLYLLGEYADMLYQGKIFEAKGDDEAAKRCAARCTDIRAAIPEYAMIFEKMDQGIENAIYQTE